jgi:hypothetical protein
MQKQLDDRKRQQMEAIKLLSDWSKWLITVETGGIVGIISVINFEKFKAAPLPIWLAAVMTLLIFTAFCFLVSIYNACLGLFSLPDITQRLITSEEDSIFEMQDEEFKVKLADYNRRQYLSFVAGLTSFALALFAWLIGGAIIPVLSNH